MYYFRSALINVPILILCSLMITACGSNGSATGGDVLQGQFKDNYVEGISYATATQSGVTDKSGTFNYQKGETVTFKLGGIVLGSAPGSQLVTPVDVVTGATDEDDDAVTNIGRLLQSLDIDGNPDNGISIPELAIREMEGISLDFSAPGFGNSPTLSDLFRRLNDANIYSQKRCLISSDAAKAHLRKSLRNEAPPPASTSNRTVQTITDSPVYDINNGLALAFDSKNLPHLITGGDHVYHFFHESTGWRSETIDLPGISGGFFIGAKLFIDSNDYLHIVFRDSSSQLKYLTNRPGYWSVETLNVTAAAVDPAGHLHTVSYDTNEKRFQYGTK